MLADKNFCMCKEFKTMLALMNSPTSQVKACKKAFIEAQVAEEAARRAALKSKDSPATGGKHSKEGVALD